LFHSNKECEMLVDFGKLKFFLIATLRKCVFKDTMIMNFYW